MVFPSQQFAKAQAAEKLRAEQRQAVVASVLIAGLLVLLTAILFTFVSTGTSQQSRSELLFLTSYFPLSTPEERPPFLRPEAEEDLRWARPPGPAMTAAKPFVRPLPVLLPLAVEVIDAPLEPLDFGSLSNRELGFEMEGGFENFSREKTASQGTVDQESGTLLSTPFGELGGTGMNGTFYDFKQDQMGRPTELAKAYGPNAAYYNSRDEFGLFFHDVQADLFSQESLAPFYQSRRQLAFRFLVVKNTGATIGPAAFGVGTEVRPSAWIVVYEGEVLVSHPKRIRLLGNFDDILLVYVNDEIVFDGSWGDRYSDAYSRMHRFVEYPRYNYHPDGMLRGDFFSLRKGDELRIVVGEVPGGRIGGGLFVEERGVDYLRRWEEEAPLVPFITDLLTPKEKRRIASYGMNIKTHNIPVFKIGARQR